MKHIYLLLFLVGCSRAPLAPDIVPKEDRTVYLSIESSSDSLNINDELILLVNVDSTKNVDARGLVSYSLTIKNENQNVLNPLDIQLFQGNGMGAILSKTNVTFDVKDSTGFLMKNLCTVTWLAFGSGNTFMIPSIDWNEEVISVFKPDTLRFSIR